MKVTGKNPRMFLGDKEIKGVSSFSLSTDGIANENEFYDNEKEFSSGTLTFTGTFDPIEKDEAEKYLKSLQEKEEDVIVGRIYNYDNEFREAKVRINYQDGQIILEPIDKDIKEWVVGWMMNTGKEINQ